MGMNKVQFGVVVALLAVLAWIEAFPLLFPQRATPSWEYRIEGIKDVELLSELGRIGRAGWEIVFARRALDGDKDPHYEVIFKRPM